MSLIFGYKIWVQNMGTQAGQAIPNFLDLAWLACVPIFCTHILYPKIRLISIPFFSASQNYLIY